MLNDMLISKLCCALSRGVLGKSGAWYDSGRGGGNPKVPGGVSRLSRDPLRRPEGVSNQGQGIPPGAGGPAGARDPRTSGLGSNSASIAQHFKNGKRQSELSFLPVIQSLHYYALHSYGLLYYSGPHWKS